MHFLLHFWRAISPQALAGAPVGPRTLTVNIGTPITVQMAVAGIINFLAFTVSAVCLVIFVVGTFFVVTSAGGSRLEQGKNMMINSIIGLLVTACAYGILRTLYFVIY
jgi:hypothetical protein